MSSSGPQKPMIPEQDFAAGSNTSDRNELVDSAQPGYLWSMAVMMCEGLDMWSLGDVAVEDQEHWTPSGWPGSGSRGHAWSW